jgi:hypothetical protein
MRRLLKRWWFWGLLIIPLIAVGSVSLIFPPQESADGKFKRIDNGMTNEQVVEIIGREPADVFPSHWSSSTHRELRELCRWTFDGTEIFVWFSNGRVTGRVLNPPPTIAHKLQAWIKRHI